MLVVKLEFADVFHPIDRPHLAVRAFKLLNVKSAFNGDRSNGKVEGGPFFHDDQHTVVKHCTWPKATLFVVPDEDKFGDAFLLETGADEATDLHGFSV